MADLAATSSTFDVWGGQKVEIVELPAVSDADTYTSKRINHIRHAIVVHSGGDAVAADKITVASTADNVVTFQVAGTARTATLQVFGY